MEPTFSFRAKLWIWPGEAAWHFVTIAPLLAKKIKGLNEGPRRGFGAVKIKATIGNTSWTTSIFPTKEKTFLLPIKQSVRKAENLSEYKSVQIRITLI